MAPSSHVMRVRLCGASATGNTHPRVCNIGCRRLEACAPGRLRLSKGACYERTIFMKSHSFLKRLIDLTIAIPLSVVALPVCLVLLIAICIDSTGSPLFIQERVGRNQRPFRIFKLRTMTAETAHVASHHLTAASITPLGSILRRFKLDELPQLVNVLNGTMSLVGPRPCLFSQHDLIARRQDCGLFTIQPGVTGPAQTLGIDMSDPERLVKVEAAYFHSSSALRDISFIIKTLLGSGNGDAVKNT